MTPHRACRTHMYPRTSASVRDNNDHASVVSPLFTEVYTGSFDETTRIAC